MSDRMRIGGGVVLVAAAVVLFLVLRGGGSSDSGKGLTVNGKAVKGTPTIRVKNGEPVGGVEKLEVKSGSAGSLPRHLGHRGRGTRPRL